MYICQCCKEKGEDTFYRGWFVACLCEFHRNELQTDLRVSNFRDKTIRVFLRRYNLV